MLNPSEDKPNNMHPQLRFLKHIISSAAEPCFYVGQEKPKINCSANIGPSLYSIFYTG